MQAYEVLFREVRRSGITYAELARRCNMDKEALRLSLNGLRQLKANEVIKLSRYFNLEISDFADVA